jgi:two-component system response regulator YesN
MADWRKYVGQRKRAKKSENSRKYFFKLIWLSCISACIPVILASAVYHYISVERMEKHILTESDSSLILLKDRAERVLQGIEHESLQLVKDPLLQKMIADPLNENAIFWHRDFLDTLSLVKNMSGFISEVFLFVSSDEVVLSNEYGVISKNHYKYKEDIDRLLESEHLTQWVQLPNGTRDGYITFSRLLPVVGTEGPKAVLAFEIDTSSFSKFLEADTVVLTRNKEFIILNYWNLFDKDRQYAGLLQRVSELKGIETILSSDKNADRFVSSGIDGKAAQFNYVKNMFSRTYISVIPEQAITSQFDWIRGVTVLILLSFIGIGIMLTLFTSKKAYSPIEKLMEHSRMLSVGRIQDRGNELEFIKACLDSLSKEKDKLVLFMEEIEPSLREKSLQQLLGGEYSRNETLLQDCEKYGIDTHCTNVVILVEAEHLYREKRFLPEERGVVAFALANVMQEIMSGHPSVNGHVIPYQGRGIAILQFAQEKDQKAMQARTLDYARATTEALKAYLSFDVAVGIGRYYSHIADVPVSYNEAENALQYRIFRDSEPILYIEDVEQAKKQTILRYPQHLASDIVDALEQGDLSSASEALGNFAEILRNSQSYVFIHQSYHILLSSIIVSLDKQSVNLMDVMDNDLFGQLKSKQTSGEICVWFEGTVFPLYVRLAQSGREIEVESGIQYICKHIREHCGQDLSLVQCAELVGVSPSYLSRLFKKEMGINFLEYVVECKVVEAKRLLQETENSISEIAELVGYSERNLNRIFQRYVKLSPGNYRAKYR